MIEKNFGGINYLFNKGKTPCLLFVHGIGTNHSTWTPYLDHFKEYSFIALDLRSHGNSLKKEISIRNFSKDIILLMENEKIDEAVVIGNSLGAIVGVDLLNLEPKKIKKLVLISPFYKENARSVLKVLFKSFNFVFGKFRSNRQLNFQGFENYKNKPSWIHPLIDLKGIYLKDYLNTLNSLVKYKADLNSIDVDSLLIVPKFDILLKHLKFRNSNMKVEEISCDHLIAYRKPKEVINLIEDFLKC